MSNEFNYGPGEKPGYETLIERNQALIDQVPSGTGRDMFIHHINEAWQTIREPNFGRLNYDVRQSTISKIIATMNADYNKFFGNTQEQQKNSGYTK